MKISIGGVPYKVKYVSGLLDEGMHKMDGMVDFSTNQISIESAMGKHAKAATLWHEVFHVILRQSGRPDNDEGLIDALAYGILGIDLFPGMEFPQ